MSKNKLWSLRYSVARGWHWVIEREITHGNASEWLRVFRTDEPDVLFKLSVRRPSLREF